MIKKLKINSKKQVRLMEFFQISLKKKTMTTLVMPHLKTEVVVRAVLEVLVASVVQIFLIFLRIFLETSVEEAEEVQEEEIRIIEVLIYDTTYQ